MLRHLSAGYTVGIVDLTAGEMGTRGSADQRLQEAAAAASVLGITVRKHLSLPDGRLQSSSQEQREAVIRTIRLFRPEIVLCNAPEDRHPDHGHAAALVQEACFLAGLHRLSTVDERHQHQEPWRPRAVYHYIQDQWLEPNLLVDVSPFWKQRMDAVRCYASQFYNPKSQEPSTYISQPEFLDSLEWRARLLGRRIGVSHAEGFITRRIPAVEHFFVLR